MYLKFRAIILVVVALVVVGGGLWLLSGQAQAQSQTGALTASGTVEAVEINIAPELGGRVNEDLVAEGGQVKAGQPVVRLDDTLLQSQIKQAQAAIAAAQAQRAAAQANYDLLKAGAQADQIAVAQEAVRVAEAGVSGAQAQYAQLKTGVRSADIAAAQAAVAEVAAQLKVARDNHDQTLKCYDYTKPDGKKDQVCPLLGTSEEQARAALQAAQDAYDAAQKRLSQVKAGATRDELDAAQAQIDAAQAQQAMAQSQLDLLRTGARPQELSAAQAQVDAAQAQVDAANAALDVLKVQLDKLTLVAPAQGLILNRAIERGAVGMPGATLPTLGKLDSLSITVYIPEDQYGQIKLGQSASVTVDSFPGQTFDAKVTYIANQAEFTPRNVQTSEGRATTVYGVKLSVSNVDGKLKPGMPADVTWK